MFYCSCFINSILFFFLSFIFWLHSLLNHSLIILFLPTTDLAPVFITSLIFSHRFSIWEFSVASFNFSLYCWLISSSTSYSFYLLFCLYIDCIFFYFFLHVIFILRLLLLGNGPNLWPVHCMIWPFLCFFLLPYL